MKPQKKFRSILVAHEVHKMFNSIIHHLRALDNLLRNQCILDDTYLHQEQVLPRNWTEKEIELRISARETRTVFPSLRQR